MATETFNTPGAATWTSPFTGTVTVKGTGAGGRGGVLVFADSGHGGGGGGYAEAAGYSVTFGQQFDYVVGTGSAGAGMGADTIWENAGIFTAGGGGNGGGVGTPSGSAVTTSNNGGNGGAGGTLVEGGGGGASGSAAGVGGDGGDGQVGTAGDGGIQPGHTGGEPGDGGAGSTGTGTGNPGFAPGGGGGGQGLLAGASTNGTGANGRLQIVYTLPTPAPTSVSPGGGTPSGGTSVTIYGTDFSTGCTVKFGATSATGIVVVSPTQITCTAPAHASGLVDVVVTNADATAGTLTNGYAYTGGSGGVLYVPNLDGV